MIVFRCRTGSSVRWSELSRAYAWLMGSQHLNPVRHQSWCSQPLCPTSTLAHVCESVNVAYWPGALRPQRAESGQTARLVAGCQLSGAQLMGSQVCKDSIKRSVGCRVWGAHRSGGQEAHTPHADLGFPLTKCRCQLISKVLPNPTFLASLLKGVLG